ncbi:MAG TPA: methylated-DNA--[protein]-cysteine S-methyltransferase [Firmicutes bacterium]|jgi:methylated-DNA-[protein]-cysteine S-methyltransferase|nr:methylated-DNA--[protein]-cysteine S-methyltransferase [Bacillota bacterium]
MAYSEWKQHIIEVPSGFVSLTFNEKGIYRLGLSRELNISEFCPAVGKEKLPWPDLADEIQGYFKGREIKGDYPIIWDGYSAWTLKVLQLTRLIPYGETVSYKRLAVMAGVPKGARAVGQALHRNRTPLLIPCHRVVGQRGCLVGFGQGLEWKRELLDLERSAQGADL